MADLWEKLRTISTRAPSLSVQPPIREVALDLSPPGWRWVTPLVAQRTLSFSMDSGFWRAISQNIEPGSWDGVCCFDTETTGLSGGAGTVAFLVGWAELKESGNDTPEVAIHQWFLRDLPGEPDLVRCLDAEFRKVRCLVSFNGASFDLPLLKTRWTMNGIPFPGLVHRDNLPVSRRLWKRLLDSCRLSRLEESVLGVHRQDDVPGSLVPALWFSYLRNDAPADFVTPLEGVLRHHAQDVYSLLCLDLLIAALHKNPDLPRWEATFNRFPERSVLTRLGPHGLLHPDLGKTTPVDFWGLVNAKSADQRPGILEAAWRTQESPMVGLAWADHLKRQKDERAKEIWRALWTQQRSYTALVELLKWLEHRDRSAEARTQALSLIDQALDAPFLPQGWRVPLTQRKIRLLQLSARSD